MHGAAERRHIEAASDADVLGEGVGIEVVDVGIIVVSIGVEMAEIGVGVVGFGVGMAWWGPKGLAKCGWMWASTPGSAGCERKMWRQWRRRQWLDLVSVG